jgi:hypothetical protein
MARIFSHIRVIRFIREICVKIFALARTLFTHEPKPLFARVICDTIRRMDFTPITEDLFIGRTPSTVDYNHLRELGVRLVINMRVEYRPRKDLHPNPIQFLWLPTFDSPLIPISLGALRRGANAALETIQNGGKVYAHCAGGVHRGAAMGAAILIAQGHHPRAAMELIKTKRPKADPFAYYIQPRILKFASQWQAGS